VWRYARWIWLFPSLWYWPSSVGKEALIMLGLGTAVAGFIGRGERVNWLLLTLGTTLVVAVRPQVAAVAMVAFILAHWLSLGSRRWTTATTIQALIILGIGLGGIRLSLRFIGVDGIGAEGIQSYMEAESAGAADGGSAIESVGVGWAGVPFALTNILTRPFPWEVRNAQMFLASLEILGFWAIVWYRRRNFLAALRGWRSDRLLRLAVPFILIYAITLGMLIANLGIIARQRVFLFPFLFVLVEAVPLRTTSRRLRPRRMSRLNAARLPEPARGGFA
jgi:hypothetical protein